MRKIMMIALMLATSSAFAQVAAQDKQGPDAEQPVQQTQVSHQAKYRRTVVQPVRFGAVGYVNNDTIEINVLSSIQAPDGSVHPIQYKYRNNVHNFGNVPGCNDLSLVAAGQDGMTGAAPLGKFALVGDFGVLVEISRGDGTGMMTLFRQTGKYSGLAPAVADVMQTDGNALMAYTPELRTSRYSWVEIMSLFQQASLSSDPRDPTVALRFLETLSETPMTRRDVSIQNGQCMDDSCDNRNIQYGPTVTRDNRINGGAVIVGRQGYNSGFVGPVNSGTWR
jgi:hypothetical protein